MNYDIYQDSDGIDPIFVLSYDMFPEFRPHIGDQITLPNDNRIFKVNRCVPADNPNDQKVTYYVELYVPNLYSQYAIIIDDLPKHF